MSSLLLEAKMSILNPHTLHRSRHLIRLNACTLWTECHADVGYNPPDVNLADNWLPDVADNFMNIDDEHLGDLVTSTEQPPSTKRSTRHLSTAAQSSTRKT